MSTSRIPLRDFLAANRLGKGDLRFGTVDHAACDDENDASEPGKKATVDATRLALMVAESYVRRNCNDHAAPLNLDCIYLVVPSEGSADNDNYLSHVKKDMEGTPDEALIVLSDNSSFICEVKDELLEDANFDALSMSQGRLDDSDIFETSILNEAGIGQMTPPNRDDGLDSAPEIDNGYEMGMMSSGGLDGSDELDVLGILNEAGFGQISSSNRDDVLDSAPEFDSGYKVCSAEGDIPFRTPDGDFENNEVTTPGTPTTTSQTTTCSPDPSSVDAILGVEIATMENEVYAEIEFHAALRMLGGVLQQIFLSTVPEAGPATSQEDASDHQDRHVDSQHQSGRVSRPRLEGSSVFSSLSEQLPFSVCRLLSDMIEPALMPEDGVRIETFFQVVDDLLSMSESPSLYLLDPSADFHSSLVFGQRCHGRKDELTSLLGVATRIEECTRRGDDIGKAQVLFSSFFSISSVDVFLSRS
ncbi:hypothetical protein THAOC_08189 [Thalassiosira oceanica]|uniref:Uncharacterized protein n=1 Tax=Thalassiosira oceanica TaxID=159749 RepID=K0SZN8_THAOC|nr:hypothetical protein THAOC_08189 [Thalassiosira oceanica]|eukprot:EJK70454.1 hypothetical protein THAOC_08189 [Thalassiosira oceanica]